MDVQEQAKIKWKDIKDEIYDDKETMIIWLQHKVKLSRKKYFSFVCEDAKETLKLLVEGRNLKPNDKVFQTNYSGLRRKVMDAAEKVGIFVNGNGCQAFRLHTYRKRGQTILEKAHVPLNWVDRILGHVPRGAQGVTYSLPDVEEMREEYEVAVPKLSVYTREGGHSKGNVITKTELCQILVQLMPNKVEEIKAFLN